MSAEPIEPLGEDRLSLHWKFVTADRLTEVAPQEFAQGAVYADTIYIGSAGGWFYALRTATGKVRWRKKIGAVLTAPIVQAGTVYVGTADGTLLALDAQTGTEKWRYQSRGPIEQPPVATVDLVVFANEADQVVAVDSITGKFKWQHKSETPEEYTLRGHAGIAIDGDLIYTGFSNGTMVALRKDTGSVAWSTSLKADADRFVDVDATPIVIADRVYTSSSSGGVYALDKTTGLVRWRLPFWDVALPSTSGNVGGIATDGKILYASVADLGTYALDLGGNVLWRVGANKGGEPATPLVWNELLIYSLAEDGMFIANRKTGDTLEYFDPGDGISAQPTVTGDGRLFVMSNRGILYAFDLD
ncbi:MAG: PQQ-binding-like beta-propeller repeat protein [Deltaproteobacteria bacterium]|nr:PQQ-binding-like beta-propeller repeat protein [Deltaproteobacteria bacterium]MDQ3299694.1 PQQ-binding-like beta-propeller repeat protein [Myxococcota bacterium]